MRETVDGFATNRTLLIFSFPLEIVLVSTFYIDGVCSFLASTS